MRTSSRLAGAALALAVMVPPSAMAIQLPGFTLEPASVGPWVAGTVDHDHFGGGMVCVAYTYAGDRDEALFMAIDKDGFRFGFASPALASYRAELGTRSRPFPLTVEVDGWPVELAGVSWSQGGDVLWLTGAEEGFSEGSLEREIKHGQRIVFGLEDHRSAFTVQRTDELMQMLTQCRTNDGAMPGRAATDAELAEWRELEDGEEGSDHFDPDALAAYFNQDAAFAQLQCFVSASSLFGVWGANEAPIELIIAVNDDASAMVQGTRIEPVGQDFASNGSGPTLGVYRAREVFAPSMRSPLAEIFADAPRPPEDDADAALMSMFGNPASMIPENRLLAVSLQNDEVIVADQGPNGQFGNRTTHACLRYR